eukprot:1381397-Pleurochrysis_carterae.AAC.5
MHDPHLVQLAQPCGDAAEHASRVLLAHARRAVALNKFEEVAAWQKLEHQLDLVDALKHVVHQQLRTCAREQSVKRGR